MKFNTEQQRAVDSNADKILCIAAAGSGKTRILIERVSRLISDGVSPSSILVNTFTNAAAFEMRERFLKRNPGVESPLFCTFHSFCYKLLASDSEVRQAVGYSQTPQIADDVAIKRLETTCKQQLGTKLTNGKLNGTEPLTAKEKFDYDLYHRQYRKLLRQGGLITFDILCYDVCELFVKNHPSIDKHKEQFKYVFSDEYQDTDSKQHNFVTSFVNSNLFVVGDVAQCQPAGTMITMLDGSKKAIEDIRIGDYVLSYNIRYGYFPTTQRYAKRVVQTASRKCDKILTVKTAGAMTNYTLEHLTYAKIHFNGNEDKHVIYIMKNSRGWYRVGSTQLFNRFSGKNDAQFGCRHRMRCEDAECVWILDVVSTASEAWLIEQICAYKYGIPQTTWTTECTCKSTDDYERLYLEIGDIESKVDVCLGHYGRSIEFPLFCKNDLRHFSKLHLFEIHACNLIPHIMDVGIHYIGENKKWKMGYSQITSVDYLDECRLVYSLDIEDYHNYVADEILTHNCIYQFRGTDNSLMKSLTYDPSWETIILPRNYRSTRQICEYSNDIFKGENDSFTIKMISDREGEPVACRISQGLGTDVNRILADTQNVRRLYSDTLPFKR